MTEQGAVNVAGLAAVIRGRREEMGLSMRQIASRAGLSNGYMSALESGRTIRPGAGTINQLAAALKVSPDALFEAMGLEATAPAGSEIGALWRELTPRERRALAGMGRVLIETRDEPQVRARRLRVAEQPVPYQEVEIEEPIGPKAAHGEPAPEEEWAEGESQVPERGE